TIFTAAFTPIPFKIITIAAGLFKVPLWSLFIASLIGRGMRFFMVAFIVRVLGQKFNDLIVKYFDILSLAAVLLVILGFVATKFLF
ncbi:MAG: DedA family protein, partial [Patescibacteria group bacterium]